MILKDKVVVITGAGGVLCSAFAEECAAHGAKVALLDIDEKAAGAVAQKINGTKSTVAQNSVAQKINAAQGTAAKSSAAQSGIGAKNAAAKTVARAYKADVLNRGNLEEVRGRILKDFGPCDILINGAGGNSPKATTADEFYNPVQPPIYPAPINFFTLEPQGFNHVFNLNILGTVLPSQVFMADMLKTACANGKKAEVNPQNQSAHCSVLNISSMNAFTPLTKIPAYSAAKAAVSNFTQWLAVHFAGRGITVNALAPGFFATNQNKALLFEADGTTPTARAGKILAATPMGRFGKPQELLQAMTLLITSSFITGVILPVDGGFSAYSGV